jgi:hypothetical protein
LQGKTAAARGGASVRRLANRHIGKARQLTVSFCATGIMCPVAGKISFLVWNQFRKTPTFNFLPTTCGGKTHFCARRIARSGQSLKERAKRRPQKEIQQDTTKGETP